MDLQGQAAIVTGGGSGLGAATARLLGQQGIKVAIIDVNEKGAKEVAQEINGLALIADVSNEQQVTEVIKKATDAHGAARVCVSCAGIAPAKRIVGKSGPMALEDFKKVIDINLIGTFNVLRLAAAEMLNLDPVSDSGERGVIINTASVAAFEGQIGQAAYSASKGGVAALTLPAAREFAQFGIRVNTIAPGLFATPLLLSMPQEVQDSLAASVPFPRRLGNPKEYAKLVQHIIENSMLNGETIRLDGAIRMEPK